MISENYTEWDWNNSRQLCQCESFKMAVQDQVIIDNIRNYDGARIVSISNNQLGRYYQIIRCPFCGAKL